MRLFKVTLRRSPSVTVILRGELLHGDGQTRAHQDTREWPCLSMSKTQGGAVQKACRTRHDGGACAGKKARGRKDTGRYAMSNLWDLRGGHLKVTDRYKRIMKSGADTQPGKVKRTRGTNISRQGGEKGSRVERRSGCKCRDLTLLMTRDTK